MTSFTLTPYRTEDLEAVTSLLQKALQAESITTTNFSRIVLLDPNFDRERALVARQSNGIVSGFLLALIRRRPLEDAPLETDRGWITLFAVDARYRSQGIGSALLAEAESCLRSLERETIWISPYAPGYWSPGVDEAAYTEGLAFLQRRGYIPVSRPLSMAASLAGWKMPEWVTQRQQLLEQQGVHFEPFTPHHILPLLEFLQAEFPGDWQRHLRETMYAILAGRRPAAELLTAWEGAKMIGFAQSEGERFGPFGVASGERGRGAGAVLLYKTLEGMQARGLHNAWFLWTNDAAADRIYRNAGFRETRRYAILKKTLR